MHRHWLTLIALWLLCAAPLHDWQGLGLRARGVSPARVDASGFNLLQLGLAMLTVLALAVLVAAVSKGLLGVPDMHVAGNGSSAWNLHWFADQSRGVLPGGDVLSLPLWVYKVAMLAWALWLASAPKPVVQSPASPLGSPPPLPSKDARDDG